MCIRDSCTSIVRTLPTSWGEKKHRVNSRANVEKLMKAYCGGSENHKGAAHNSRMQSKKDNKPAEPTIPKKYSNPVPVKSKHFDLFADSASAVDFSFYGTPGGKKCPLLFAKPVTIEDAYTKISELQVHVQQLKDKLDALNKRQAEVKNAKQLRKYLCDIEEAYASYSKLSEKTVRQRRSEKKQFEEYAEACQSRQKASVDAKQEMSHIRMKIKLLQETLDKRNRDYNSLASKKRETVIV
eukprot:TRINITY_DN2500_c0_g2_i1.p1 TRINITY_DN2500_c0_g2~~TRINITY_DN2500_c0_g2_i1.p1  ORF type:complete len:240 (+),score=64.61 TRINITY_DN2500_c0_g2_i1:82-801(+)